MRSCDNAHLRLARPAARPHTRGGGGSMGALHPTPDRASGRRMSHVPVTHNPHTRRCLRVLPAQNQAVPASSRQRDDGEAKGSIARRGNHTEV